MKKVFLSLFSLLINLVGLFHPNLLPILKLFSFVPEIASFVDSVEDMLAEDNDEEDFEDDDTDC